MPQLGSQYPNMVDVAKATGPDGKILRTAEILTKLSPIMRTLPMVEGNLTLGHMVQVRTSIPTPTSRRLNQRVLPTKSTTDQNTEQCSQLVDYADVDCSIADLNGNADAYRMNQAYAHLEGMVQEAERQIVYGNSAVVQEEIDGFIPRMAAASDTVIDAGGSGSDNGSIILAGFSPTTVYGIFPKGSRAGIRHENKGKRVSETSAGMIDVYTDRWQLDFGIAVEDPNWLGAIRAIDISSLVADPTGASINLMNLMLKLVHSMPRPDSTSVNLKFITNRTIYSMFDIQAMNKNNAFLKVGEEEGVLKTRFRGIEILVSDAMTESEAVI